MPRPLLALVLVLLATGASAEDRPSRADLQKALRLYERSVVRVRGPREAGPGVIVGTEGQVLTSVRHVSLEAAQVEYDGRTLPATVVLANGYLKVAVVAAPAGEYPAAPVRVATGSPVGQWLIGIIPGRGKQKERPSSALARKAPAPFFDVDLALPPGSPLFDTQGRLVAVSVQRRGRGCRALPLDVVKQQLATKVAAP
ncbi:trypsin-like peptidase domain-containing protein [Archangium violaceum]|uniref:MXAN_2756 family trypsin-like serine endoprotease n=1 Tax=Archangium violaceum TaxID=83451 RepID=UPI001951DA85|nr:serine protease [Archangium violaceum]QRN94094.1 trypsin-like peptidase domain-containing protein [Archangium violaceum]